MELDHLVYAVPDLEAGIAELERQLGVRPTTGGSHPGVGTRNALLSLGDAAYLEIIAPDPAQPSPPRPRPFGLDGLADPRIAGWAVKATDLEARVEEARLRGYELGAVRTMERDTPLGLSLRWRLTSLQSAAGGLVPFLIDWGDSPHPARSATQGSRLVDWFGQHPDPPAVERILACLGVELEIRAGPVPGLVATLSSLGRKVVLGGGCRA